MGLRLTGFFLDRELRPVLHDRPLPEARARLVDLIVAAFPKRRMMSPL
jgi:DNA repair protein RecO (recombination protein O)